MIQNCESSRPSAPRRPSGSPKLPFSIDSILAQAGPPPRAPTRVSALFGWALREPLGSAFTPNWRLPGDFAAAWGAPWSRPSVSQPCPEAPRAAIHPAGAPCPLQGLELAEHPALHGHLTWGPADPLNKMAGASKSSRKRSRTVFSSEQLEELEKAFGKQPYLVGTERTQLAEQLRLSETQVKVWFQNRRIKGRKQSLEQKKKKLPSLAKVSLCPPLSPQEPSSSSREDRDGRPTTTVPAGVSGFQNGRQLPRRPTSSAASSL